jgi:hypothetical protein
MMRHPALALSLAALMALALVLGGPGLARAGGRVAVLCTVEGPVQVTLDAGGAAPAPAPADRHCPACLVAAEAPALPPPLPGWSPAPRPAPHGPARSPVTPPAPAATPLARAPPLPV